MSTVYPAYRGLRFEEDEALKARLSGLTVPDTKNRAVPVKVWFRSPERELREVTYPYIMIDSLGIRRDPEREHRGVMFWDTEPYTDNATGLAQSWWPIPMLLRYQISVVSRNNQHDVILNDILSTTLLPWRFGGLVCESGTVRRLDVLGMTTQDSLDENNKRVFRKVWTIEVEAEIVDDYEPVVPPTELVITIEEEGQEVDSPITIPFVEEPL